MLSGGEKHCDRRVILLRLDAESLRVRGFDGDGGRDPVQADLKFGL